MQRLNGWENNLNAVIKKHMALPSEYGVSDCYLIADDAVEAVTGERMFADIQYSNEIGAAKELRRYGFETVADAFAFKFEEIAPSLAHRGDIGVIENNAGQICGGFFSSIGFVARDENNLVFLPVSKVKTAYKVAR